MNAFAPEIFNSCISALDFLSVIAKKGEEATLECVYTGPETVTSLTLEVEKEGSWTAVQTDTFITAVNQYVVMYRQICCNLALYPL